jgi:hypothetical protein
VVAQNSKRPKKATWHYKTELSLVLAWTVGTAILAAIIIASLLRGKLD